MHESVLPEMGSLVGVGFICFASLIVLYVVHSLLFAVPHPKGVSLLRELPGKRDLVWWIDPIISLTVNLFSAKRIRTWVFWAFRIRERLTCPTPYCKKGKAVIIPGIGFRDEVILPVTSIRWALAQPESVLSNNEAFLEVDQVSIASVIRSMSGTHGSPCLWSEKWMPF